MHFDYFLGLPILLIMCFHFIHAYYSPKRFYKSVISYFKLNKPALLLIGSYALSILLFYVFDPIYGYLLTYTNKFIFIIIFPHNFFRLHSRGYRLVSVSLIIYTLTFMLPPNLYFILNPILPIIALIMAYLLLFFVEKLIQSHYIKKAKAKIKSINPLIIGITGSFGKTTFKTYLASLLKTKYCVFSPPGNINTLMGITKWINDQVDDRCEVVVLEIGIDENHAILKFKKLLDLDFAVITGVGHVHLATFKTYENIINSKCEIEKLLKPEGKLIINGEYEELKNHKFNNKVVIYNHVYNNDDRLNKFQVTSLQGVLKFKDLLNLNDRNIEVFLNTLPAVSRRFEVLEYCGDIYINDSYNINPEGFYASLEFLKKQQGIKIVITSGLLELGKDFVKENRRLAKSMDFVSKLIFISKNKRHPFATCYQKTFNKEVTFVSNLEEAKKIVTEIKVKKAVLICASGSDLFLA